VSEIQKLIISINQKIKSIRSDISHESCQLRARNEERDRQVNDLETIVYELENMLKKEENDGND
jgi:hypothetical protein